jgi:hypothetical protein
MTHKLGVGKVRWDTHDIKELVKRINTTYNFQDLELKVKNDTHTIKGVHTTFKTQTQIHKGLDLNNRSNTHNIRGQ